MCDFFISFFILRGPWDTMSRQNWIKCQFLHETLLNIHAASGFPFFIVQYLNPFHEEILGKRWKRDGMQNRKRVVQRDSISSGKERQEYLAHYFHGLGQNESVREWKVILKRPEKTLLLFSVWKVTLHFKCSALGWPWEVRTMNVKVDFTLCNSLCDRCGHHAHIYTLKTHQRIMYLCKYVETCRIWKCLYDHTEVQQTSRNSYT